MFSAIISITEGKLVSAIRAGSKPCCCAASVNAVPLRLLFTASQLTTSKISWGFVEAVVICASRESG
jgi:hypothetical protein